ncbi:recombinase family protein [Planctomicrobium sp. SH661]|uniref:recombinase family protein n=1 Tax=Planctomicrobium sp. SH661 TaxID=3448124 RepID=UPI003F5C04E1
MSLTAQKVTAEHLQRNAYLYVRQSTLRQVIENTESTQRQYGLRQRAVALGWPAEQITVIDSDLGESGASTDREGFQQLVSEVGLGRAGMVMGLEVSRLARNSSDWHRLLEICALSGTLILDEDGLYDPSHFNDRLLLGLKGTMSEAELHVLRARLQGGLLNKARRGELNFLLPVGLIRDHQDRVILNPDQQVQQALQLLFETYDRLGTATAVVRFFREQGLLFPRQLQRGVRKGEILWGPLEHSRTLQVLHNPRYSGTYVYGRHRVDKIGSRKTPVALNPEDWQIVIPDAHPGYISWPQFQQNLQRLRECSQAYGRDRRRSPPGQGPALLQGLAVCGICGQRMTLRYHTRHGRELPTYVCQRDGIEHATSPCQAISGQVIDDAVSALLLELMTPLTLEVALAVQQELEQRLEEVDRLRQQHVQRAQYEADLARQRYMEVDPRHRLVADSLEADWNEKLRKLSAAQEEYTSQSARDRLLLDEQTRQKVRQLASDFPAVWNDPHTLYQDRKRMVRLLVEDVTLLKGEQITVQVRLKGGSTRTLLVQPALSAGKARQTSTEVLRELDRLLDEHPPGQVAELLNASGFQTGERQFFTTRIVVRLCKVYHLKTHYDRLRAAGKLTHQELATQLHVAPQTIRIWAHHGLLQRHVYNDKQECLYDPPDAATPVKSQGQKLSERQRFPPLNPHRNNEVHDAT